MSLLRDVVAQMEAEGIPLALIGAAAMAVHGVSRAAAEQAPFDTRASASQHRQPTTLALPQRPG